LLYYFRSAFSLNSRMRKISEHVMDKRTDSSGQPTPYIHPQARANWQEILALEDVRCNKEQRNASILQLEVIGTVDGPVSARVQRERLCAAAIEVLNAQTKPEDIIARIDDATFVVLLRDCGAEDVVTAADAIVRALIERSVVAAIGHGSREGQQRLAQAWRTADTMMYQNKRSHRKSVAAANGRQELANGQSAPKVVSKP
jgi:Diguanylate cyclase, GGDEF domain